MALIPRRKFIHDGTKLIGGLALTSCKALPGTGSETLETGPTVTQEEEYDFVVVGSGAGGGPLAVNLAKRGFQVLVIEAGDKQEPLSAKVPTLFNDSGEDPAMSWEFFVKHYDDPARHALWDKERGGRFYPRASVLGGCTVHNAMITLYPDPNDWVRIQKHFVDHSGAWNPDRMQKLFVERVANATYYNKGSGTGWLNLEHTPISLAAQDPLLIKMLVGASKAAGVFQTLRNTLSVNVLNAAGDAWLDSNNLRNFSTPGLVRMPKSTRDGMRYSVNNYLLETEATHPNLTIRANNTATRIIFGEYDGITNPVAIGVETLEVPPGQHLYGAAQRQVRVSRKAATKKFYKARREVILAGGAYNTPQLLMLSGIGPQDNLIDPYVLRNDWVGKNLQDRYEVTWVEKFKDGVDYKDISRCTLKGDLRKHVQDLDPKTLTSRGKKIETGDPCLDDWLDPEKRAKSVYSSNGVVVANRLASKHAQDHRAKNIAKAFSKNKVEDVIVFGVPGSFKGYFRGYSQHLKETSGQFGNQRKMFTWAVLKGYSHNRSDSSRDIDKLGYVKLKSKDPLDTPEINFRYFEKDGAKDIEAIIDGMKFAERANKESGLFGGRHYPPEEVTEDKYEDWIKQHAWGHHASCSCRMGENRYTSVVGHDFKVHGTDNLRIVDASVFPEIPGLFIVTPIYMISEKASDDILAEHPNRSARPRYQGKSPKKTYGPRRQA